MRKYEETRRMDQQKPKTKIKVKTTRKHQETRRMICQSGWKRSRTIWLMNVFQNTETLPVLLMNYLQSREQKSGVGQAQHFHSLPEGPKLRNLLENKNHKGFLQKRHWFGRAKSGKIFPFITADHKGLSEGSESRNNHRYAVVVQD